MEFAVLFALIVINGFFALSEIALVTARRARLQKLAEAGDRRAEMALRLAGNPTRFLSTVQIGITSIGVLNGIVGESALAQPLAGQLEALGMPSRASALTATALVVTLITYVTIVLGELVPKRMGQANPERLARLVARPMNGLAIAARPFVVLLTESTELILRMLRLPAPGAQQITEDEIHAILDEGSSAGVIERAEHAMVRNVFRLEDRPVTSLMTPRADVVYLDLEQPLEENLRRVRESPHSRFPVTRHRWQEVLGIVNARQLLARALQGQLAGLDAELESPVYVPDSQSGLDLLESFRAAQFQMALVVDEYGQIRGLVTLHDLIEAIAGQIRTTSSDDSRAVQRADGSWLLDGSIPVPEIKDHLGLRSMPAGESDTYDTLGGMIQLQLDRVPRTGDIVRHEGWSFEIVDMDGRRIDKVLAQRSSE